MNSSKFYYKVILTDRQWLFEISSVCASSYCSVYKRITQHTNQLTHLYDLMIDTPPYYLLTEIQNTETRLNLGPEQEINHNSRVLLNDTVQVTYV